MGFGKRTRPKKCTGQDDCKIAWCDTWRPLLRQNQSVDEERKLLHKWTVHLCKRLVTDSYYQKKWWYKKKLVRTKKSRKTLGHHRKKWAKRWLTKMFGPLVWSPGPSSQVYVVLTTTAMFWSYKTTQEILKRWQLKKVSVVKESFITPQVFRGA